MKLARHLDPNGVIPKYKLQYLRYYLGIQIKASAHDALGDILVLEKLFERLFAKMNKDTGLATAVENKMMEISNKLILLSRMYLGRHKGQLFRDIQKDYLKWLSGTGDMDEDMRFTMGHYLNG